MSTISQLVKELRDLENDPEIDCYGINELNNVCARAADTIEALSAKLQAVNMENGGGWIYCGDGKNLPKEKEWYMTTCVVGNGSPFSQELYFDGAKFDTEEIEAEYYYTLCKVLAWQPLPEPYRP